MINETQPIQIQKQSVFVEKKIEQNREEYIRQLGQKLKTGEIQTIEQELKGMNNLEQIKQYKIQKGLKPDKIEMGVITRDAQMIYQRKLGKKE